MIKIMTTLKKYLFFFIINYNINYYYLKFILIYI